MNKKSLQARIVQEAMISLKLGTVPTSLKLTSGRVYIKYSCCFSINSLDRADPLIRRELYAGFYGALFSLKNQ
jgi:hypothetical protein